MKNFNHEDFESAKEDEEDFILDNNGKREELEGDSEVPLEIQDYTAINKWEQLINDLDLTLIKWNVNDPSKLDSSVESKVKDLLSAEFIYCKV